MKRARVREEEVLPRQEEVFQVDSLVSMGGIVQHYMSMMRLCNWGSKWVLCAIICALMIVSLSGFINSVE